MHAVITDEYPLVRKSPIQRVTRTKFFPIFPGVTKIDKNTKSSKKSEKKYKIDLYVLNTLIHSFNMISNAETLISALKDTRIPHPDVKNAVQRLQIIVDTLNLILA